MRLVFKIAWRNLWRHKGKSLVVGVILFIGAFLMTVGNGMIAGMEKGLSENIINLFTGDIVVISDEQQNNDILFSIDGRPLKVIKNYPLVQKALQDQKVVRDYLPATAGMVYIFNPGSEMGNTRMLGVDIKQYAQMFPGSFKIVEGRTLKPGERGLLVSEKVRGVSYDTMGFWTVPVDGKLKKKSLPKAAAKRIENLKVKREIVFMGATTSNTSTDVQVSVRGIIKYKSLNGFWGDYNIVDIESFRQAHDYLDSSSQDAPVSRKQQELLSNDNYTQFYSSGVIVNNTAKDLPSLAEVQSQTRKKIGETKTDSTSYNLIFLKLKQDISKDEALARLNKQFKANKVKVRAVSWKEAIGSIGSMTVMIKGALNLFIMFIFFVAIIVIMNTLFMAALERVSELGMMRAIGARKGFLRKMFICETGMLSFFFGGIGIVTGVIIVYLLNAANITTTTELLQIVYGGDKLNPIINAANLLGGVIELGFVTLIAALYPLRVVGRIVALDAVTRE